jgi:N-acetylglucosaminyldiphosphoundecaprenol N-acetyl-beta-D-mannosaminyltransferase
LICANLPLVPSLWTRAFPFTRNFCGQDMYKQNIAPLVPTRPGGHTCAVRLGKIMLYSMAVDELLSSNRHELKHVATVHSEMFVYAHENAAFEALLRRTINTIDGRIVQGLCSLLYPGRNIRKITGADLIYDLANYAVIHGERVFLLGAEAASNQDAVEALKARYPGLVIDGYSPPFCSDIQEEKWNQGIRSRIASFRPTHLVVCFGPLKQEMWIAQNAEALFKLGVRCAYGLGGTLDFVSGRKTRAPKWIQRVGAEWLFRVITEPQRLGRTAKMFKMPYFVLKFYHREVRIPEEHGGVDASLASPTRVNAE